LDLIFEVADCAGAIGGVLEHPSGTVLGCPRWHRSALLTVPAVPATIVADRPRIGPKLRSSPDGVLLYYLWPFTLW
jgi:hypothetical protein